MPNTPDFFNTNGVRVLIATDDDMAYSVFDQQITPHGYLLTQSRCSQEVLDLIEKEKFSIILAEHDLTEMTGMDLFDRIRENHPAIARILICGSLPPSGVAEAVASGTLFRFLSKPWQRDELLISLRTGLHYNRLITNNKTTHEENIQLNLKLKTTAPPPTKTQTNLQKKPAKSSPLEIEAEPEKTSVYSDATPLEGPPGIDLSIQAFLRMLYAFHPNLGNTALRTKVLCQALGKVLNLSPSESTSLICAGALHDLGLIQIDRELVRRWLRRPDKCEDKELVILERHPEHTRDMLEEFDYFQSAGEIITSHHECWDGSGYPEGLKEDMIPWLSRILSVAISFCSKPIPGILAMAEIEEEAETKFDPDAISALAKAASMAELPRSEREVQLIELRKGMTLAEDIFNGYGFLLLPHGSEITDTLVSKIWAADRVAPIEPYILIYS